MYRDIIVNRCRSTARWKTGQELEMGLDANAALACGR
jgi:hypothetical protein